MFSALLLLSQLVFTQNAVATGCLDDPEVVAFTRTLTNFKVVPPGCRLHDALKDTKDDKGISSTYLPRNKGLLTQRPSQIKDDGTGITTYQNWLQYYGGVPGMLDDLSVRQKMSKVIADVCPEVASITSPFFADHGPFDKAYQPQFGTDYSWGSCGPMAIMGVDKTFIKDMDGIREGILCQHVGFEREELAELMTSLTGDPMKNGTLYQYKISHFVPEAITDKIDGGKGLNDANLAWEALGQLGKSYDFTPNDPQHIHSDWAAQDLNRQQGPITPDKIFETFKNTDENPPGKMLIDLNLNTTNIWNQGVEKVIDLAYTDESTESGGGAYAEGSELSAVDGYGVLLDDIAAAEKDLEQYALRQKHVDSATAPSVSGKLVDLYRHFSQVLPKQISSTTTSDPVILPARESLLDQVNHLKQMQQKLVKWKVLRNPNPVVKHKIFMHYVDEAHYGVNSRVPSGDLSLNYVDVGGRVTWLPPLPPKAIKVNLDYQPPAGAPQEFQGQNPVCFSHGDLAKTVACNCFLQMVSTCRTGDAFDHDAALINHVVSAITNDSLASSLGSLKAEYQYAKGQGGDQLLNEKQFADNIQKAIAAAGEVSASNAPARGQDPAQARASTISTLTAQVSQIVQ